jgi:hypothetical protein
MNTAPHLHDEANSRLFQAFRSIRGLFQERFPGAYVLQEDTLHQEWCVLAHVPWKDFFRFVYGDPLPRAACERLVEAAPAMMDKIRSVAEGRAAKPIWALEQRRAHRTF